MNINTSFNPPVVNSTANTSRLTISDCTVWTALITPFTEQGDIDFHCLIALAHEQAEAGNGILLLGSTGEGLALTEQEQWQIVTTICDLTLNTPLMVAVGGYQIQSQIAWIEKCNTLPIHAYLLGSPLYSKPGPVGQFEWFNALLNASIFPCMLYNVPSRSGVNLAPSALAQLQTHVNCWSLKEASGDLQQFLRYRAQCPALDIYSGEDDMMPYLANAGVKGLVSVCANVWPKATKQYVEKSLEGKVTGLFPVWQQAVASLFSVANPIPVKVLLHEKQLINSPYLRPPLTHLELNNSQELMAANEKINVWLASA